MTEAEIKAVADELEARVAAAAKAKWSKVWSFVTHNVLATVVGGVGVLVLLKWVL